MASQALAAPQPDREVAFRAANATPTVLVVDDDRACIEQCAQILGDLHYAHRCVASPRDALELLARDASIEVLIAGAEMPGADGFMLVEEARARLGQSRPVAAILMTPKLTAELALRAMHVEAVDFLTKPIAYDAYSGALRRALRYLDARRPAAEEPRIADFSDQLSRLIAALEPGEGEPKENGAAGEPSDGQIAGTLRLMITSRAMRDRYFPSQFFADPAWDILLDLTRAKLDGQQVSVSSVCIAASVPMSTALRWVRQMTEAGLLRRWTDPKDRRRDLIALTDTTAKHMIDYLAAAYAMMAKV